MTDARLPERWLNDRRFLLLSPEAHLLYTRALMFAVANRTDGLIHDDDLALIPGVDPARAGELAKTDLWLRHGDAWLIADFEETQTSRDDLEKLADMRRNARARQREHRAVSRDSHVTLSDESDMGPLSRDSSVTVRVTQLGQDRLGKGAVKKQNNAGSGASDEVASAVDGHRTANPHVTRVTGNDDWHLVEPPPPLDYEDETA